MIAAAGVCSIVFGLGFGLPGVLGTLHVAGTVHPDPRLEELRRQRDVVEERTAAGLPAERALQWLRALGESLQATEKSKEKADVMHASYDRITVAGPGIVGVRLTQAAYARFGAGTARKG